MTTLVIALFLAFFAARYAIGVALSVLNLRHTVAARGVPAPLSGQVDAETAARSRAYTIANGRFGLLHGTYDAAVTLAVLFSGLLPWLESVVARTGLGQATRFVLFLVVLSALASLADLPFGVYHTFVLEHRFGFNRTTFRLWVVDRLKGIALALVLGVPFLYGVHAFMAHTGRLWWLWLFGFVTAVQVVMLWLYPSLIAPLFNKFTPLADGELRQRLESLAREAGFRNRGLFVVDASRRSSHSNAYFTGLFRPRIVLFDTLVAQMTAEEAAAVLAHEIGHFKAHHIHKRLAIGIGTTLLSLYVLSWLIAWPPLFRAFGFAAPSYAAAIALFSLGGGAFTFFLEPVASWFSRRNEYEADRYSIRVAHAPEALESALVRLNGENLSNLDPHPWYSAWHYSHPTLLERIAAIRREAARMPRGTSDGALPAAGAPAS